MAAFSSLKMLPSCYAMAPHSGPGLQLPASWTAGILFAYSIPKQEFSPQRDTDGIFDIVLSIFVLKSQALSFFWFKAVMASITM